MAYPPLHSHRGSVNINRSYEKAEAREDPANKEMIEIVGSGGGEGRREKRGILSKVLT